MQQAGCMTQYEINIAEQISTGISDSDAFREANAKWKEEEWCRSIFRAFLRRVIFFYLSPVRSRR